MPKVISAVFYSNSAALSAADILRQNPDGIINIKITSAGRHEFAQNSFTNVAAPSVGSFTDVFAPEMGVYFSSTQTILTVSCKDNMEQDVISKLSAASGQKISVKN